MSNADKPSKEFEEIPALAISRRNWWEEQSKGVPENLLLEEVDREGLGLLGPARWDFHHGPENKSPTRGRIHLCRLYFVQQSLLAVGRRDHTF